MCKTWLGVLPLNESIKVDVCSRLKVIWFSHPYNGSHTYRNIQHIEETETPAPGEPSVRPDSGPKHFLKDFTQHNFNIALDADSLSSQCRRASSLVRGNFLELLSDRNESHYIRFSELCEALTSCVVSSQQKKVTGDGNKGP